MTSQNSRSSERSEEYERLNSILPKAVENLPAAVKFRALNAIDGFARAKVLIPIDLEMASFRAITAGEEAASGLIRSLQLREYPRSELIDLRKHTHKAAVPFFLSAVREDLAANGPINLRMTLSVDPPALRIALPLRQFVNLPDDMQNYHMELADPLCMIGSKPGVEEADQFDAAVRRVAGSRKVDKLIASEANARNRILYAHDAGLPRSQASLDSIELRERQGILCILLAVAVLQVDHHQGMAVQCLNGFLKVIGRADRAASAIS